MSNNQTTPIPSTILRNKLGRLATRLQQQANPKGTDGLFNTLEKTVTESIKILSQFYKQLSEPSYKPTNVIVDTVPSAEDFNNNFIAIQDDLEVIYSEFENLEGVVVGSFNYMVTRLNRLDRKLKSVFSQLGDFILYSDLVTKDALFFSDSFNNLYRVEVNSPLLNKEQCEINQVEGIATLPVDRKAQVAINITEIPVINSNSNGTSGNNEEAGASLHGNISDILDNNADTWFEYERVLSKDDGKALTLDFTINIGSEKIINFIRINPNNFGAKTQVKILAIDTSVDGKDFVSIKDEIPIADFVVEDEENIFTLAPSTSKFAGQGLYSFTPRKAKYVHFTLQQSSTYTILNNKGTQKYRYAIGIRDVDIQAIPYKEKGELISTNFLLNDDIRKVVLLSNQRPSAETTSVLTSIEHFVSPDNGITWHQIRPAVSAGLANADQTIPELLDFNGVSVDSVATSAAVRGLRYKAVMTRNTDAFSSDSTELAQNIDTVTELHSPPTTTPFTIKLQKTPIDGTLKLIDPQFGSRGKEDNKYSIAIGTGDKLAILLPFKPLKRDVEPYLDTNWYIRDKDPQTVYVDGTAWTRAKAVGATDEYYSLNFEEGRLSFGNGTVGKAVPKDSIVSMTLEEEQIFPSRGTDHIAELNYPTSNDQKQVIVSILHPAKSDTALLKKGTTRHQLQPDIITNASPYAFTFSDAVTFATPKTFIDGSSEFSAPGAKEYSVDYTNGVLYSNVKTSIIADTTVTYFYYPRTILSEDEWKFTDVNSGITNAISIYDSAFLTFEGDTVTVPTGVNYFCLGKLGIVRGTVVFTDSNTPADDSLKEEVSFIDGYTELTGAIKAKEQLDAITGISGTVTRFIPFKTQVSTSTALSATFSNQNVFQSEQANKADVDAPGASVGDYWIDRNHTLAPTGGIYVKLDANSANPGTVTYYYVNPQAVLIGRYSINYETGEVFSYTSTGANITVDFEYTNYRVKYDIARLVSSEDWEYDSKNNNVVIKDREILRNIRTPQQSGKATSLTSKFYQISYQYIKSSRADANELEPYFTCVLKDYALKVITTSKLV